VLGGQETENIGNDYVINYGVAARGDRGEGELGGFG